MHMSNLFDLETHFILTIFLKHFGVNGVSGGVVQGVVPERWLEHERVNQKELDLVREQTEKKTANLAACVSRNFAFEGWFKQELVLFLSCDHARGSAERVNANHCLYIRLVQGVVGTIKK